MKVTLVGTSDKAGGAARAMYRLHQSLLSIGIQSRILCMNQSIDTLLDSEISKFNYNFLSRKKYPFLQDLINENRTPLSNTLFSYTDSRCDFINHPFIQDADIINLHWISYFVSTEAIGKLLKLGKRIVWTLHDEWAYTGGCHYTSGCDAYLKYCSACPQLASEMSALPELSYLEKGLNFSSEINLVSPSNWLAKKASESRFFRKSAIKVIPNSIEPDWFAESDRQVLRKKYGYFSDCFLIGFGADSIVEKRKGLSYLLEALQILSKNKEWADAFNAKRIGILFFGNYTQNDSELNSYAQYIGSFSDDKTLSSIYKTLDLFLIPSLEDNLPNTLLESMASGTPVLGFPIGGLAETITHKQNGFLTENIAADSLAEQLFYLWQNKSLLTNIGATASEYARSNFSMNKQANSYREFFEMVLSNKDKPKQDSNPEELSKFRLKKLKSKFDNLYDKYTAAFPFRRKIVNFLLKSNYIARLILLRKASRVS